MSRNYQVGTVVAQLNKKHDVFVEPNESGIGGVIKLLFGPRAKGDIGIGSKGKISFLENHEGYRKEWVNPDAK